jgi:hypothetical protein
MNENQLTVMIEPESGNILIALGQIRISMIPRDAISLMVCVGTVLAQHPQLQPKAAPQIFVATALPAIAGGINLDGR